MCVCVCGGGGGGVHACVRAYVCVCLLECYEIMIGNSEGSD